jgi:RimJ/RimL family protein N-acetyltransferase
VPAAGSESGPVVATARLVLRPFEDMDRAPFFALNTHPLVVESLGSAPTRAESDDMIERYSAEMVREGWGLWAVGEGADGGGGAAVAAFVGMVGLHRVRPEMPCAPAVEIGWRLHPDFWGRGYATEAAAAALRFGFEEAGLNEIVAFTTTLNTRSQAVMARIGMRRDVDGDFDHPSVPEGSPLRRHVLYRATAGGGDGGGDGTVARSQSAPTVRP